MIYSMLDTLYNARRSIDLKINKSKVKAVMLDKKNRVNNLRKIAKKLEEVDEFIYLVD